VCVKVDIKTLKSSSPGVDEGIEGQAVRGERDRVEGLSIAFKKYIWKGMKICS
jgi:hypothetical protein